LCDTVQKRWLDNWRKKNWVKANNKPVLNRDLWERLVPLLDRHRIVFHWIEANAGHPKNEAVDSLARSEAAKPGLPGDDGFMPGEY
jgi:ribonuclease HI